MVKNPPQTVRIIQFHHIKMRLVQFLQILLTLIMNINLQPNSSYYQMCISKMRVKIINNIFFFIIITCRTNIFLINILILLRKNVKNSKMRFLSCSDHKD